MNMEFLPVWLEDLNRVMNPDGIEACRLNDDELQAFLQTPRVKNMVAHIPQDAPIVAALEVDNRVHLFIRSEAGVTIAIIFIAPTLTKEFLIQIANTIVSGFLEAVKERGVQALAIPSAN